MVRLSDRHRAWLRAPAPPGEGVCAVCLTACPGHYRCHRCHRQPAAADAVLPVSYSVHGSALHSLVRRYKRDPRASTLRLRLRVLVAALLWRFLAGHEACLARAAGVAAFDQVCIVPSGRGDPRRRHPLGDVVESIDLLAPRVRGLLVVAPRTGAHPSRRFDPLRFACRGPLGGAAVLLVDDTWTTGASAQSAAGALKRAGARAVGVVVIARHLRAEYGDNRAWLAAARADFDWDRCALCCARPPIRYRNSILTSN